MNNEELYIPYGGLTHPFDNFIHNLLPALFQDLPNALTCLLVGCILEESFHKMVDRLLAMAHGTVFENWK